MSDFFVKAIIDDLADAGMPLSTQQVLALVGSRKRATAKAREEIKNAVRATLVSEGIKAADIQQAARDMTKDIINNILKERQLQDVVNNAVDAAIKEVLAQVQKSLPKGNAIADVVKRQVAIEAAELARKTVNAAIHITFNEANQYEQGGTF